MNSNEKVTSMFKVTIVFATLLLIIGIAVRKNINLNKKVKVYDDSWIEWDEKVEQRLSHWKADSVKLLLFHENGKEVLMAQKRSRAKDPKKHKKWEFPGGRIEFDLDFKQTLIKELKEEDPSKVLLKIVDRFKEKKRPLYVTRLHLGNNEKLIMFRTTITESEWEQLDAYWQEQKKRNKEVFGWDLWEIRSLLGNRKKDWPEFTPKTIRILKSLNERHLLEEVKVQI